MMVRLHHFTVIALPRTNFAHCSKALSRDDSPRLRKMDEKGHLIVMAFTLVAMVSTLT